MTEILNGTNSKKQPRGKVIFDSWFGKWFIQRLPAALVWYWFLLRFFGKSLPYYPDLYRECLLIFPLIAILLMGLFGRWVRLILYPFYIFFFPLLILWLLFRLIATIANIPIKINRYSYSVYFYLTLLLFFTVGCILLVFLDNAIWRAISMLVIHITIYIIFLQGFRWAANPYRPMTKILNFIGEKGTNLIEFSVSDLNKIKHGQSTETAIQICDIVLSVLDFFNPGDESEEKGIRNITYNYLIPLSIYGFIALYFILAISFGVTLFFIEKAWGPQISGLLENPSLFNYLYYSFLSLAASVPEQFIPVSTIGYLWVIWTATTGILLLTFLIVMFTTSIGIHGESALRRIILGIERSKENVKVWKDSISSDHLTDSEITDQNIIDIKPEDSSDL